MENIEQTQDIDLCKEKIAYDTLAMCAIKATLSTNGVIGLSGGLTDSISENILGIENLKKGIKVDQGDKTVSLEVFVFLKYGAHIPAVAWDIQENVKKEIESITDKKVSSVNIHVQGVKLAEEENDDKNRS